VPARNVDERGDRTNPHGLLSLLAALTLLALAACGGDDGAASDETADFIAKADEICRRADEEAVAQIGRKFAGLDPENAKPRELRRLAEEILVPSMKKQLKELRALLAPEADADELNRIYAKLEASIDEVLDDPTLVLAGSTPSLQEATQLASDFGFKECGR